MAVKYFSKPIFIATLICVVFFYFNKEIILKNENVISLINPSDITFIKGKITSSPSKTSNGKYYSCYFEPSFVKSKNEIKSSATGIIKIYIPSKMVEVFFPGKLFSIANKNKGYLFEKGGNYSFVGKNISHGFYADDCTESVWADSFIGKFSYIRALCRLHFKRLMYGWGAGGGLLLSLLSGAREYTNIETADAFKNAGLSHILALSGMHLSMFSAIAMFFGKKLRRKKLSYIIRITALVLFVWFAGFSPSLLRAFICAIMMIFAAVAGVEQPDMIMVLCFSFLLQSILYPADIYNVGFMLSYGALAGILLTGKFFYMIFIRFIPSNISSSLSASAGAQIFTAPITLKLFGTFSPIGIVATTIISPLITIFIYTGLFLIILTMICPVFQTASGIFINLQYNVINNLVIFFSHAPIWSLN